MTAPSTIVATLARMLDVLHTDSSDRDLLKSAFRDLYAAVEPTGATISIDVKGMIIDGTPLPHGLPGGGEVRIRFHTHGIGTVRLPAGVKPADLLAVVRLLATEPVGAATVESFVSRLPVEAALAILVEGPRQLPTSSDTRSLDHLSAPIGGGPAASPPPAPVASVLPEPGARVRRDQPEHDPLRDIEVQADLAYRREEWDELLGLATEVLRLEAAEGDESRRRRYSVALRRLLPKSALQHIARAALSEGRRAEATAVLKRMDADAVEALLELLTAAPTLAERRGYFTVLTKMETGTERIVHRLNHPDWFVVRNVAELCGELRLASAVRPLAERAFHRDERVRRAVAGALGKIGSTDALEAMRHLLNDVEPMVRLQAAQGVDGEWGRGLVMSIAVRLPEETHPDVLREMHLALGRVGTPEAVQVLRGAAAPAKGLLARKSSAVRLAAVEGLALAGGATAAGALQELLGDADAEVRAAAQRGLSRG
ncbi:MAG TPA: HEAT repeat domain-containing protein [Gemmatimonadales bacterium]|nr:HEAT repeat domain-containing protein [Gemmatimonadales bacterium]